MSRKLPLCAKCGGSLTGRAQLRVMYEAVPGKPEIGWHGETASGCTKDPLFKVCMEDLRKDAKRSKHTDKILRALLNQINARGTGRVVANKNYQIFEAKGEVKK